MNREAITETAQTLRDKYGILPSDELLSKLGACLCPVPMGSDEDALKGFVQRASRVPTVVVNSDQPEEVQDIVKYHESGHIALKHYDQVKGICRFHEFNMFDSRSRLENEANTFVAEYLLEDERTLERLKEYPNIFAAAASLHVPPEIMTYKLRMLKYYGILHGEIPISVNSNCMGKIRFNGIRNDDFA